MSESKISMVSGGKIFSVVSTLIIKLCTFLVFLIHLLL